MPTPPEFPKPLVRLKPVPGGYDAEVRMVTSSEEESIATDQGWQVVTPPDKPPDFAEFPKWVYHADGQRRIVQSQAEADALEGFTDTPPTTEAPPPA